MQQPLGYENQDATMVCLFRKSLYGLQQGRRQWNTN